MCRAYACSTCRATVPRVGGSVSESGDQHPTSVATAATVRRTALGQATCSERFDNPIQKPSMTCSGGAWVSVAAPSVTNSGL